MKTEETKKSTEEQNEALLQANVSVSVTEINANAICLDCGTAKQNSVNGFCINDHDNWLEIDDNIERFSEASEKFKKTVDEIIFSIENNICITEH